MIDLGLPTYKEGAFTVFNSGGIEAEVGELLYGFVRTIKPLNILETGTHKGISAAYMGLALKENGKGNLVTLEFDEQHWGDAEGLWRQLGINQIEPIHKRVEDYLPGRPYDMFFLDSEPEYRWKELERFYDFLNPGGYAFIHDLHRTWCKGNFNPDHPTYENWPFGKIPETILTLLKERKLKEFHFPTERGLTGFYKSKSDDFEI